MRRQQNDERRLPILRVAALAFAVLMGLVAVFEAVNAVLDAGVVAALWLDATLCVVLGALAWVAHWLAGQGRYQGGAWLLVAAVTVRAFLAALFVEPAHFALVAPLYAVPIVLAQILISSRAGTGLAAASLLMFACAWASASANAAGTPIEALPLTASACLLLFLLITSLVHVAISQMNAAVRRADQSLSASERARTELHEREEQFRALAESSATGIVIHQDGHLVYGNPHFFEMAHMPRGDVFGLSLWDFFDKTGVERLQAQVARRRSTTGRATAPEQLLFHPAKSAARWCEVAVAEAVFRQRPAIVATMLDVTELVEAQLEVQRERDFTNNIIATADALIMVLDASGHIVLMNPAGERITGYSGPELRGAPFWTTITGPERQAEGQAMFAAMQQDPSGQIETTLVSKAGDDVIVAWHWVAQRDAAGQLSGVVAVGLDVTQQRLLERQAMVTERLRALGQVSGGVAHDLNNMLAGIMGPADLMLLDETDPEKERSLSAILAAAKRGAETVKRIQRFAQARTELDRQEFDLRQLVDDVVFTLKPRWRDAAQKQGITIKVTNEVPEGLKVLASSGEIGNVVTNLIVNACEAMTASGSITITGGVHGQLIEFRVRDTGSGMSPETAAQIFQPFFSTKGADNSGLGLAVIRGIILRHGGSIEVQSELGVGTTFLITLPAAAAPLTALAATEDKGEEMDTLKVLVVDDMQDIADFIVRVMQRQGHEAVAALTGEAALQLLEGQHFDVLITDYGMEGISGPDLAGQARQLQPAIKVVLITGWDVSSDEFAGFDAVLQKPFTRDQIQEVLDQITQAEA